MYSNSFLHLDQEYEKSVKGLHNLCYKMLSVQNWFTLPSCSFMVLLLFSITQIGKSCIWIYWGVKFESWSLDSGGIRKKDHQPRIPLCNTHHMTNHRTVLSTLDQWARATWDLFLPCQRARRKKEGEKHTLFAPRSQEGKQEHRAESGPDRRAPAVPPPSMPCCDEVLPTLQLSTADQQEF